MFNPFTTGSSSPLASATITDLRIYPIKSCRGISLDSSTLTKQGLSLDRNWMFCSGPNNTFLTIRDNPSFTLISTSLSPSPPSSSISTSGEEKEEDEEQLTITIRTTPHTISIPARPTHEWLTAHCQLQKVVIWETETDGWIYPDSINQTFREFLGIEDVKLVYKGPTKRILKGNGAPQELGREESTNFPDVLPVLVANAGSLGELNERLSVKWKGRHKEEEGNRSGKGGEIEIERFRPNIVVSGREGEGMEAWSEDSWKTVRIIDPETESQRKQNEGIWTRFVGGEKKGLEIDIVARCARCQVPNVDPETAEKDKKEPWDTLVSYRRVDEGVKWKPCFGMLGVPREEGEVKVGMRLEVMERTEAHKYIKGF